MVEQVLIVKYRDGKEKRIKRANWSTLIDVREKYDNDPRVQDTILEYDI